MLTFKGGPGPVSFEVFEMSLFGGKLEERTRTHNKLTSQMVSYLADLCCFQSLTILQRFLLKF